MPQGRLGELVGLHDVGHRSAEQAERDPVRALESHRLDKRCERRALQPAAADGRRALDGGGAGDLRGGSNRPRAWAAFLRSPLKRARATRSERPDLARQAARWGVTGGAAWLAARVAVRRRTEVQPPALAGLAWWSAVWRMLDWHLGMAEGGDGVPRAGLSPADAVTLTRYWLVPALRPAIRARPGGVVMRVGGLALCTTGLPRIGTPLLTAGCLVPPRSTAPRSPPPKMPPTDGGRRS